MTATAVDADPLPAVTLDAQRALVERVIGRPLRPAERPIDVLGLDAALNRAKDELDRAIRAEQARAVRRGIRRPGVAHIELTAAMLQPLERLYRLGRREALAELRRIDVQPRDPRRAYAAEPEYPRLDPVAALIRKLLRGLSVRVEAKRVSLEVSEEFGSDAVARAMLRVPGARDIASRAISGALTAGMSETWSANDDLVGGWEQTAVLDGGTCGACAEADGTVFATWDDAQLTMPDGGPYVDCDGDERCRCRLVPLAP